MAKTEKKRPWLKFYPSDWRGDPKLRMCSIAARGLWAEMICLMHEADPYGHLLVNGAPVTNRQLASLAGIPQADCMKFLLELESAGVYSRSETKTIFSRRMVREGMKAQEGRVAVDRRWDAPERADPQTRAQRLAAARRLGKHSPEEWSALLDISGNKCVCCGGNESGKGVVKDHIIPIYQGGSDAIENLQPMCQPCNSGKGPDTTDHRLHDWKKRLDKRLGRTHLMPSEMPTLYSRVQIDDAKTRAGASLISPEAFEITTALEQACGFTLPEEVPPGWYGCAMWVQKCLNEGWIGEVMIEAAKAVALRKKGGFIESFKYLEKPLAQAMAEHKAPLPQVEVRQSEKLTVIANGKSESLANVAARLAESGVTFGERPRGIRAEESGDHVRLLSKG